MMLFITWGCSKLMSSFAGGHAEKVHCVLQYSIYVEFSSCD